MKRGILGIGLLAMAVLAGTVVAQEATTRGARRGRATTSATTRPREGRSASTRPSGRGAATRSAASGPAAPRAGGPPAMLASLDAKRDIEYANVGGKGLLLDLYYLKADNPPAKPLPLVVYIHGGAWVGGDKAGLRDNILWVVNRGYILASINYRLSGEAKWPAQIFDCKAAIRFLRAHAAEYRIDADHIGVWGDSAGGHLVALLGTSGGVKELEGSEGNEAVSSRVQAVCDWYGPTDFLKIGDFPSNLKHNAPDSPESMLLGSPVLESKDKAVQANPITYIDKADPPFLIMHGDKDMTVPINQSELLQEALQKAGVESTFKVVNGAGHGGGGFNLTGSRELIQEFFDKHLKGIAASQPTTRPAGR